MAGGIATTLLGAARPGAGIAGELGLFEVDELWLASLADELRPRAILLGNLFRDQLDRYGELETIADSWARLLAPGRRAAGAQRRRPADRRPRPRSRGRALLRHGGRLAGAARAWRTPPTPSTAAAAARRTSSTRCISATSATITAPAAARRRPLPAVTASRGALEGVRAARFTLHTPAGEGEVALALPGLYNVYNALAAAALATALEVPLRDDRRGPGGHAGGLRARRERDAGAPRARGGAGARRRARELRILLVKNPAGAQRGAAHARARARRARPARGAQRPDRRRPRRLLDLGRRLRAARRARCGASRAAAAAPPIWPRG